MSNGRRSHNIQGKLFGYDYLNYKEVYNKAVNQDSISTVVNLERLHDLLGTLKRFADNAQKETKLHIDFAEDGTLVLRVVNLKTQQLSISVLQSYKNLEKTTLCKGIFEKSLLVMNKRVKTVKRWLKPNTQR